MRVIIILLFISSCTEPDKVISNISGKFSYNVNKHEINYEIEKLDSVLFISKEYCCVDIIRSNQNDSIIIQAVPDLNYAENCQFPVIEMVNSKLVHLPVKGIVKNIVISKGLDMSRCLFFIKAYNKSYQEYLIDEKENEANENSFLEFEHKYSILIKLVYWPIYDSDFLSAVPKDFKPGFEKPFMFCHVE